MDHRLLFLRPLFRILKESLSEWWLDDAPHLAAALAFYTLMSLAPLAIIAVAVTGSIFGKAAAQGQIVEHTQAFIGTHAANMIENIIERTWMAQSGFFAPAISVVILLVSSTAVFAELHQALNKVWEVRPLGSVKSVLSARLVSFLVVLAIGVLFLAALLANAGLALVIAFVKSQAPGLARLLFLANAVLPLMATTVLFAMFFKVLPDVHIAWRDVWKGAIITSLLFILGNYLLGFYLRRSVLASAYGAAGSLFVFLLWVYYSAQIFLLGAEITHVFARHAGRDITPARGAVASSQGVKNDKHPDQTTAG
jgi:membrane protein